MASDAQTPLFSEDLISPEVAAQLPEGYKIRPLQRSDYAAGFLDVLRVLTTVGDVTEEVLPHFPLQPFSHPSPPQTPFPRYLSFVTRPVLTLFVTAMERALRLDLLPLRFLLPTLRPRLLPKDRRHRRPAR